MSKIWTPEEIQEFQDRFYVKCILRPDGMYDVRGRIDCSFNKVREDLTFLPPIYNIYGSIELYDNKISSLENIPRRIYENFGIRANNLTSLRGFPEYVKGGFDCTENENLRFTMKEFNKLNIKGYRFYSDYQVIINDPKEFIKKGMLPI